MIKKEFTETTPGYPTNEDEYKIEILPSNYTKFDLTFKLVIIGAPYVGKSSLIRRASDNIFIENYKETEGFYYSSFNLKVNEKNIKIQIWDIGGKELYNSSISSLYKDKSLVIFVYAIDDKKAFLILKIFLMI